MFISDAYAVAAKDMRIEWRARTTTAQVIPFAMLVLVLFGFAMNANLSMLQQITPGLFWMTALFVTVVATQSSTSLESTDGAYRVLLLSGLYPAAAFIGKTAAVTVKLLAVEIVLIPGVTVLYDAKIVSPLLVGVTCIAATIGLASAGSLLGTVVSGLRAHQTILPILFLPVAAPVLIAASRAFGDAFNVTIVDGWVWVCLLAIFATINLVIGALVYGTLLEDI